jgi:hypothetical protein
MNPSSPPSVNAIIENNGALNNVRTTKTPTAVNRKGFS